MTYLNGDVDVPVGSHRLFPYFSNLLILTACISRALSVTANAPIYFRPGAYTFFNSRQFPVTVKLPEFGPIECALKQERYHVIQVRFEPKQSPAGNTVGLGLTREASNSICLATILPVFSTFFEDNVAWLLQNVHSVKSQWPGVIGFARVVRNAVAHGGSIKINPNATPVTWHHLSYGPAENGKQIIGTDLIFGDLMILMFELSDELDRRGCPR